MADSHDGHHDVDATFEIEPPNYTMAPNVLFDYWMPELSHSELRTLLVLVRTTFGFHRSAVAMTAPDIAERGGLSERSVRSAVETLEARGLVTREVRYRRNGNRAPTSYTVTVRGMPPPDTAPPDGDKRTTDEHHDESSLPATVAASLPATVAGYDVKENPSVNKPTKPGPRGDGGGNRPTQEHHDGTAVGSVADCTRLHVNGHDHDHDHVNGDGAVSDSGAGAATDGTPDGDGTGAVDAEIVTLLRAAGVRVHTARKLADGSHSLGEVRAAIAGCIERELGAGAVVNALRRGWYSDAEPPPLPLPPPATVADAVEYVRATRLGLSDAIAEMAARWPETAAMADAVREQVRAEGVAQWAARVQAREERLEDCPASIRDNVELALRGTLMPSAFGATRDAFGAAAELHEIRDAAEAANAPAAEVAALENAAVRAWDVAEATAAVRDAWLAAEFAEFAWRDENTAEADAVLEQELAELREAGAALELAELRADAPQGELLALEARWRSAATEMASGELRRAVAAGDGEAECEALDELIELSCGLM